MSQQTTLNLTLKKKWFDMIASGEKKEEYREIKPYWMNRLTRYSETMSPDDWYPEELCSEILRFPESYQEAMLLYGCRFRRFDEVVAKNGYAKNCPVVRWAHKGIRIGKPNPAWCEPGDVDKTVFILGIGELIKQPK